MKKLYFPPSGFGFWYQLGVFNRIYESNDIILGCSSGSLICLISILNKEDRNFERMSEIALKIQKEKLKYINLHVYVSEFINSIFEIINTYDDNYIKKKLSKIGIIISTLNYYSLVKKIITPDNLHHLRDCIIASCYIPIISRHKNLFYYQFSGMYCIDGAFCSFFSKNDQYLCINSLKYTSIIPCSYHKAHSIYYQGLSNNVNKYQGNGMILLIIICNNIYDLLYHIKHICYNIIKYILYEKIH